MSHKVFLRADADQNIGYGHFIRSLALADMLRNEFDCTFFTQEPNDFQCLEIQRICELVKLPADNTKFGFFLESLKGDEIVVLDNYFYTSDYEKIIKEKGCKLVSIGSNDRYYYADVVVNFTKLQPTDFSTESYTRFCLGLEWTILRKPFYKKIKVAKDGIVICIGGTDQFSYLEIFYDAIRNKYPNKRISIIATDRIGESRIDSFKQRGINLKLNLTAEEMALQFAKSEIAVVSASGVAIEALSQGANVVAGHYMKNQLNIYNALQEDGYIWGVGSFSDDSIIDTILGAIFAANNGEQKRKFEASNTVLRYRELFKSLC